MIFSVEKLNHTIMEVLDELLFLEERSLKKGPLKSFSLSEIHTIDAVGLFSKKTMSETARRLNITVGTMTTNINNLVKKGLVNRYKDEDDRRLVRIGLSKKGKVLYRTHEKFHKNLVENVIEDLTLEEQQIFYKIMVKIYNQLTNYEPIEYEEKIS